MLRKSDSVRSTSPNKSALKQRKKKSNSPEAFPSFAKALFHGRILSDRLFPFPKPKKEEQEILRLILDAVQKLSKELDTAKIEDGSCIPESVLTKLKEMGLFGLLIPEEYGGLGLTNSMYVQIVSAVALLDPSITVVLGAHQSIGLKAVLMFGSTEQKRKYLPRLSTGEWIAAFALTEPGAGSDAQGITTTAELSSDGKHYLLNGSKIWITNGGIAHFFTVFARTRHSNGNGKHQDKITAFIVTRDMPGFSSGPEEKKLGLLGSSTTALHFENVKVPVENVIGEPGNGFKIAMSVLNNGRLGLAGACALGSKKLIQMAMEHALQRKQFGQPLTTFGLIQSKFANMAIDTFAAESMVRITANLMDQGIFDYSLESAMCKIFCTESEWRVVNETLQIAGGAGFMREYGYEKALRDSRIFTIWEGANEVLRLFVGLAGLQGPGEEMNEISQAWKKPLTDFSYSLGLLSDFGVRWLQRRVTTPEHLRETHPVFHRESATFEKFTAYLASESERALLKYGKRIIENEYVTRRFADIGIDLYAIACTLSHASQIAAEKGEEGASLEIAIAKAFCRKARRRMAENFRRLDRNDDDLETRIANGLYARGGYAQSGSFSLA